MELNCLPKSQIPDEFAGPETVLRDPTASDFNLTFPQVHKTRFGLPSSAYLYWRVFRPVPFSLRTGMSLLAPALCRRRICLARFVGASPEK